jgi:cysteine desulfurase
MVDVDDHTSRPLPAYDLPNQVVYVYKRVNKEQAVRQIYLDFNATTPILSSVLEAMNPYLQVHYGNSSSSHSLGLAAREGIEDARRKVAAMLGCDSDEVVFTSCGTESNNLAIKGLLFSGNPGSKGHLVVSAIEHAAVMNPARFLERLGYELTVVPCDSDGVVHAESVQKALRPNTRLVSIMHANNEVGAIQPIEEIAELCHQQNVLIHTDAAQSIGKISTFVEDLKVDLLTIAGHKFYAPKGVGALYVRKGVCLEPLLHGASHEMGMRGGTLNTPFIVGLGEAAHWVGKQRDESADRMRALRDRFEAQLRHGIPELIVNAEQAPRLPNTSSLTFPRVNGFELLKRIPELCASLGTACHGPESAISSTLKAMGCTGKHSDGTVRFSLGWQTAETEIDRAVSLLLDAWENMAEKGKVR